MARGPGNPKVVPPRFRLNTRWPMKNCPYSLESLAWRGWKSNSEQGKGSFSDASFTSAGSQKPGTHSCEIFSKPFSGHSCVTNCVLSWRGIVMMSPPCQNVKTPQGGNWLRMRKANSRTVEQKVDPVTVQTGRMRQMKMSGHARWMCHQMTSDDSVRRWERFHPGRRDEDPSERDSHTDTEADEEPRHWEFITAQEITRLQNWAQRKLMACYEKARLERQGRPPRRQQVQLTQFTRRMRAQQPSEGPQELWRTLHGSTGRVLRRDSNLFHSCLYRDMDGRSDLELRRLRDAPYSQSIPRQQKLQILQRMLESHFMEQSITTN